jgi:hypothetical protein
MEGALSFFRENGYFVLHGALRRAEVDAITAAMADQARAHPEEWQVSGARKRGVGAPAVGADSPQLLERTKALDSLAYHPSVLPFARGVLGPRATLSSFTYIHRLPCDIPPPSNDLNEGDARCLTRQWHREYGGTIEGASRNDYFTPALQVIYYLDDVGPDNHCFSVIPESAAVKRSLPTCQGKLGLRIDDYGPYGNGKVRTGPATGSYLHPLRPTWVDAYGRELARRTGGVDCYAGAGAAVLLNNASFHCVTERHTTRHRRTVHVRYRLPEPVTSSHGIKPPFQSVAEYTRALPKRPALQRPPLTGAGGDNGIAKM